MFVGKWTAEIVRVPGLGMGWDELVLSVSVRPIPWDGTNTDRIFEWLYPMGWDGYG